MTASTHGQSLIHIEIGFSVQAGKSEQVLPRILHPAFSDEKPRGLGGECDTGDQERQPHPLQSPGKTISPFALIAELGLDNSDSDDLTDTPAEVARGVPKTSGSAGAGERRVQSNLYSHVGGQVSSKGDRAYFRGVGDGQGLPNTPGNSCCPKKIRKRRSETL